MIRSVFCPVFATACCIASLVLVPQARPDEYVVFGDSYAAIAYSPSTGKV